MESDKYQNTKDRLSSIEDLFEDAEEYGKTSIELLKLKTLDISSEILSLCVSRLIVVLILLMCLFMLSMGVAFWVGNLLGKSSYGFFIVAAFYVFIWLIFYFFLGKHIKKYVSNSIIKQVLK